MQPKGWQLIDIISSVQCLYMDISHRTTLSVLCLATVKYDMFADKDIQTIFILPQLRLQQKLYLKMVTQ